MGFLSKLNNLFGSNQPQKQATAAIGGYEAAAFSRDVSYIFKPNPEEFSNPDSFTRSEIISLSRYMAQNYPLTQRILSLSRTYAIGGGLIAEAVTPDSAFNTANTSLFDKWSNSVFSDSRNEITFYEAQKLMVSELLLAGEVFLVLVSTPKGAPQITLIKSEDIRHSGDKADASVDGLYVDDFGKVQAYNVFRGKAFTKVSAENVIHLKWNRSIGQLRGVGIFASALQSMRHHKDMNLLIKRCINNHLKIATVITKTGGGAGQNPSVVPVDQNLAPTTSKTNIGLERVYGGQTAYLNPDEDVKLLTSEAPTPNVMEFLESLMKEVCFSCSLPYAFVVDPASVNGVGIRFIIQQAAAYFKELQDIVIDGCLNRVYSWVTAKSIKNGLVSSPVTGLPWDCIFVRPESITIDPQRVSNTEIALLQAGLLTRNVYWGNRGKDWKAMTDQWFTEQKYLVQKADEMGLPVELVLQAKQGAATLEMPEEADDTAEEEKPTNEDSENN